MKFALLAAAATAITLSSGAAAVLSSSIAAADTVQTSPYRPFGTKISRTDRFQQHVTERQYYRQHYAPQHVYVPAPRPYVSPEVRHARAHLADVRDRAYADGRVSLFEKIKLKAAENRYNATVRGYR